MTYDDDLYGYAETLPDREQLMRDLRAENAERGIIIAAGICAVFYAAVLVLAVLLGAW